MALGHVVPGMRLTGLSHILSDSGEAPPKPTASEGHSSSQTPGMLPADGSLAGTQTGNGTTTQKAASSPNKRLLVWSQWLVDQRCKALSLYLSLEQFCGASQFQGPLGAGLDLCGQVQLSPTFLCSILLPLSTAGCLCWVLLSKPPKCPPPPESLLSYPGLNFLNRKARHFGEMLFIIIIIIAFKVLEF